MSEALEAHGYFLAWGFLVAFVVGYVVGILLSERHFARVCERCQEKRAKTGGASNRSIRYAVLLAAFLYATLLVFSDTAFSRGWLMRAATVVVGAGAGAFAAHAGCAHDAWAECVLCHQTGRPANPKVES